VQSGRRERFSRPGLSRKGLALVTRQFATLVRAGLTIEEGLNVLIEQTESAGARTLFAAVRARVLEGQSLSHQSGRVSQRVPADLPRHDRSRRALGAARRRAGTACRLHRESGSLARPGHHRLHLPCAPDRSRVPRHRVPRRIRRAAGTRVFANLGQTLPLVTRVLIAISDFARASGALWLAGLVLAFVAEGCCCATKLGGGAGTAGCCGCRSWGGSSAESIAARFADTLGILTASGVPLLASLQSAAAVLTNLPMRAAVDEAVRRVREGGALAPALGAAKLFPPIVIHLIASGEATGRLDTMLARAAEAQSRELVNWTRGLTALLGPLSSSRWAG